MALTQHHLATICCTGAQDPKSTCRYVTYDQASGKQCCAKLVPKMKADIDKQVAGSSTRRYWNSGWWGGTGDGSHCAGYHYLPLVQQGIDVKKP